MDLTLVEALSHGVRHALDPREIFNPGKG